jgi:ABC-type nickel/cobalt efflux system permease component RcnA
MNETVLTTIAFTGFTVAFFHAAIPTHWLPFVAAGRAQRWTHSKTLLITALAGTGHVLATAVLGLILTIFGVALSSRIGTWFPRIAGALLIALGLFYIWQQLSGHAHSHTHLFSKGGHQHEHELRESLAHFRGPDISRTRTSDWVAISSLFAMLTFSPCEAFLPIYVSGIRFGWGGFALLTLILSTAAVAGMLVFTWLALIGIRGIGLGWFERYESLMMGSLLLLVGVVVLVFEK